MRKYKNFDDYYFKEIGKSMKPIQLFRRAKSFNGSKLIFGQDEDTFDVCLEGILHFTYDKKHPYYYTREFYLHDDTSDVYRLETISVLSPFSPNKVSLFK